MSSISGDEKPKSADLPQRPEKQNDVDVMRRPLIGQLLKFTNAFQGYQPRWFVLDPRRSELSYYLKEEHHEAKHPRGILNLNGANVVPSDEDSLAFTVCPAIGEPVYRLKASDTKQKTEWINRLRTASEEQRERRLRDHQVRTPSVAEPIRHGVARETAVMHNIYKILTAMSDQIQVLNRSIDMLPDSQTHGRLNTNILTLKAVAQSCYFAIENSWTALNEIQSLGINVSHLSNTNDSHPVTDGARRNTDVTKSPSLALRGSFRSNSNNHHLLHPHVVDERLSNYNESDEKPDTAAHSVQTEPIATEAQKLLILTLLSDMKLGTDLTRFHFPAFILQDRSTLEMLSDFFSNTAYFLNIASENATKPEQRLTAIVKWFLSSFYFGTKDAMARKPYNPVLGEVFRCSWQVSAGATVHFVAEQVSHHPPVSAFCAYSSEKQLYISGCLSPKSKFMGTSLCTALLGDVFLTIGDQTHGRQVYRFTLPTLFARSILSTPWLEFGGKCHIAHSQKPEHCASVTFHTKPFYGGKMHRVTGELKNGGGRVYGHFQGEWNKQLEFTYDDENAGGEMIDVSAIDRCDRLIRPPERQSDRESRQVWRIVSKTISGGNYDEAETEKKRVEDANRNIQPNRYVPVYFEKRHKSSNDSLNSNSDMDKSGWIFKEFPPVINCK